VNPTGLNPEQRTAVVTHSGPVLILAGAGTGKTRVITHRIASMVQKGIPPGNILAVTFTNKAAKEMQSRVRELLPKPKTRQDSGEKIEKGSDRPTICTFHSLCVRILRMHIEKLGYKKNFVIFDESDQLGAVRKILSAISGKGPNSDPAAVLSLLSQFRNGGSRAAAFQDPNVSALAEHVSIRYESALRACNAVDFDDLILLTLRLFREHEDALEACRARYRYVMVDEYQDTNAAQFELVNRLTQVSRNLCVVGDDDQSIYGWRGAEIANLLDLEKHFPEVKVVKLEQNYRSTNIILRAANKVIANNTRRRGKQLWSSKGDGAKIQLQCFTNDEEEARVVVENLEYDRIARRIPWTQQAILFRTNLQARPIETALRKAKVRYRLIGGQSFFDRREIRDFFAYMRVFINPHDDVSLLRIANTPARGLSDVTMERILGASQERNCSVFAVMRHTDVQSGFQARTGEAIRTFLRFIEETRQPLESNETLKLGSWAEAWLETTGYVAELTRQEKNAEAAENRIRNLREIISNLDAELEDARGGTPLDRLTEYLEKVTLDNDRGEEDEKTDGVTLITLHAAKGLEFPHVQIVGLEDGLLPHSRSKVEGTMDEERRLFYVGITRAQETLRLSHCAARKKYGQLLPCHPSPFLKELPPDCVEDADVASSKPVASESGGDWFAAMRAALD
jgi:superfamily I DNA/RNA helicase